MELPAFINQCKPLNQGECRSCGEVIWWATTVKGKSHPLNGDGSSHFATCPQGKVWSRLKRMREHKAAKK